MTFEIRNLTGETVTLGGTSYINGSWIPIHHYLGFQNLSWSRNDVDGPNAGRSIDGMMIRDRVATKNKWEASLTGVVKSDTAQAIMKILYPETFYVRTDFPFGTVSSYYVYSNNVKAKFSMLKANGDEYFADVSFPIVEM